MADLFFGPIIEKLIEFLVEEVQSLKGVGAEVRSLIEELKIIDPLLKDAEAKLEKGSQNDTIKAWLRQLREEAHHIECVIDEYHYRLLEVKFESGFKGFVRKSSSSIKSLKLRHEIASKIRTRKQSLSDIKGRAQGYGLKPLEQIGSTSNQEHADPRLSSLYVEEFVDVNSTLKELRQFLVEGSPTLSVITLVGEGGIGKTTLARKVFEDDIVTRHFQSVHEWITVSQTYNLKKILKKMVEAICKQDRSVVEQYDINDLIDCLRKSLEQKRYVVVFDDVWEEKFWEDIKCALPSNDEGSRVIITTRKGEIADSCKRTTNDLKKELQPWSETHAQELFCKIALPHEFQGNCRAELRQLSNKIVNKCQGLPLVISSIAGLLATKEKVVEWEQVLDDLTSKVRNSPHDSRVQEIISLSYYDLPYHLRFCFLSFGLFAEDYCISDERLYRLWVTEGFIKAKSNKTLEEIAKDYLSQLVQRNLVSVALRQHGEGYLMKVHDLMREIILLKAEDYYFCQIWDEKESRFIGNGHRLTIFDCVEFHLKSVESSGIRSLFLTDIDAELTEPFMIYLFKKLKLLKVLHVDRVPIKTIPKEVGKLFCLKYLSLRYTKVKVLPKSIAKLQHLQSLDIRDTLIRELPIELNKLKKLRHILAYAYIPNEGSFTYMAGVKVKEDFTFSEELQTLLILEADLGGVPLVKRLEKSTKMRWLGVSKCTEEMMPAICDAILKMSGLEKLLLSAINGNEVLDLQHVSTPPRFLRDLNLIGQLGKIPPWIAQLQNLNAVVLTESKLLDDPVKFLKYVPNLEMFSLLCNAYIGDQLHFEDGSFLKLKNLALFALFGLKTVRFDNGALPVLEYLEIKGCPKIQQLPNWQPLTKLQTIQFNGKRLKVIRNH